ncbi:MAG: ABC transporter permease [Pseudomonadota bacterium]
MSGVDNTAQGDITPAVDASAAAQVAPSVPWWKRDAAAPWLLLLALVLIWEAVCWIFWIPKFVLPPPSMVLASLWEWHAVIAGHALQTLYTTILGFVFAVAGGLALGAAVGYSRYLYVALYPLLIGFNSIPKVAFVSILVLWFGVGTIPAVITAFLLAFFPIVVNVAAGLATVEPEMEDVLRSLGASQRDIFWKVGLPRSMPYFFASLKIAITLAFVGSVISETIAANSGIGYLLINATSRFDVPLYFAGLVVVAAMGVIVYSLFASIEGRFTGWATRGQSVRFENSGGGG